MYHAVWKVSFKYSENVYCTNLYLGTKNGAENHYQKYDSVNIYEASIGDIREAERKGMPIIRGE